ncbi:MAG: hypothetical protein HQL87_18615 [Magnetococcales bacterium]|nr:hypothetical protein [Magnetococcales bacterium]
MSVNADEGIGGYGFDRLYVDVNELTSHNGMTGDVLISGWKGLNVGAAGVQSDSDKGWLVLMSGSAGLVRKAGQVSAMNGQAACISGITMIMPYALTGRAMQGFNGYMVPQIDISPATSTLESFNSRLAQEWTRQSKGNSSLDQFNSAAQDLANPMRGLSDRGIAAFTVSVVDELGSPRVTTALLDAALRMTHNPPQEEILGTNQFGNAAQSAFTARSAPAHGNAPPAQPTPVQPGPVQPTSVQPGPLQPVPVQPGPVQPAPVQPESIQPESVQQESVQPELPTESLRPMPATEPTSKSTDDSSEDKTKGNQEQR